MSSDVMVDLETMGRVAGCAILSIGAVRFDRERQELGDEFYEVVRLDSCLEAGLHEDPDTAAWWAKQSAEAQRVLTQARRTRGNLKLATALKRFNEYLGTGVYLWGNGADFDNAILQHACWRVGVTPAWDFWRNRCYRTYKGLVPQVKAARSGTHHNALDDAKTQAEHALRIYRELHGRP